MRQAPILVVAACMVALVLSPLLGPAPQADEDAPGAALNGETRSSDAAPAEDCPLTLLLPVPQALPVTQPCYLPAATLEESEGVGSASGSSTFGFQNIVISGATAAGEPTIGITPTGNVFFQESIRTWKSPDGGRSWAVVATVPPEGVSIDPLLWVDPITGRVFVTHLYGACSHTWMSDDEGASWTYVPFTCGTPVNDHQKLATGPYATPPPGGDAIYPNAVYYCYNGVVYGGCALSTTGGLTWQPAVPITCGGLNGHPHVAADGSVYVPSDHCGDFNGASVSRNNGLTWTTSTTAATGKLAGVGVEPDITSTADGTLYMSATVAGTLGLNAGQYPYVFISTDRGATWTARNITGGTGVQSVAFPVIVSGADGRVAVAFHGAQDAKPPGQVASTTAWHLYVAVTYDAGATWTTVQATPSPGSGPVQRGPICLNGLSCMENRNLLEFMDIGLDKDGYVLVGYADGCIHGSCRDDTTSEASLGTVARQTLGPPLR